MEIDFGRTAADYSTHRAGFPNSFFQVLSEKGIVRAGKKAVDLGTGTGTVARGLARLGCHVTAIDPAEAMLEEARKIAAREKCSVEFAVGRAEETNLKNKSYDIVTAGQCWHWFDSKRALTEVQRILVTDGALVIAHNDWLPYRNNVVWHTEKLIMKYNPDWNFGGGTGVYPQWFQDMGEAGFKNIKSFSYDEPVPYTHEAWRGRIRASAGVGASLPQEAVEGFDLELKELLHRLFPDSLTAVPHRIFVVYGYNS